jgi:hypothetical protein
LLPNDHEEKSISFPIFQRWPRSGIDVHAAVRFVAVSAEDVPAGFINPEAKLPQGMQKFGTTRLRDDATNEVIATQPPGTMLSYG